VEVEKAPEEGIPRVPGFAQGARILSRDCRVIKYVGRSLRSFVALPAPPLRQFIDHYEGEEFDGTDYPARYGPRLLRFPIEFVELTICYDGTSYLMENERRRLHAGSIIEGEHDIRTPFFVDNCPTSNKQVHIKFKPGGFFAIFGVRDGEMRNSFFGTDEILGNQTKQLEDRMNDPLTIGERVEVLDRFFTKKLCARRNEACIPITTAAVNLIVARKGALRISDLSKELFISRRTLQREFVNRIGLSPKEIARIVRFKSVLDRLLSAERVDWFELVQSYGYYDQSHLIEEFRNATTFSPEYFLRENGKSIVKFRGMLFLLRRQSELRDPHLQGLLKDAMRSEPKEKL
jgi:AraC-like DNA-binding protein